MRRTAALVTALALVGAGCGATLTASSGNALVAPGTASGTSTSVRLYDRGGPASKLILKVLTLSASAVALAGAARPVGSTTSSTSRDECYGSSCQRVTTTTTTTTYVVDPATGQQVAATQAAIDDAIATTPYRAFPFETIVELATDRAGGDTSGWMAWYFYAPPARRVGPVAVALAGGLGAGQLAFAARERKVLVPAGGGFATSTVMAPSEHAYVGTPLRLTIYPRPWLWTYAQADLNWASAWEDWFDPEERDDIEANPWRVGARARWRRVEVGVEWLSDRLSAQASSLGVEAGFVY